MNESDKEPRLDTKWYSWWPPGWRFYGNLKYHLLASIVYLTVSLLPLALYTMKGDPLLEMWPVCHLPKEMRQDIVVWAKANARYVVPWAMFVALIYPLWQWREVSALDRWCKGKPKEDVDEIRKEFDRYTKLAENFWKAVWGIYSIAGIMGIALNKEPDVPKKPVKAVDAQVAPAQGRPSQP